MSDRDQPKAAQKASASLMRRVDAVSEARFGPSAACWMPRTTQYRPPEASYPGDPGFISYAREDHDRAARLVETFKSRGWSVFWDQRIPAGLTWRNTIGEALASATRVIVLWTTNSIESDWVTQEADEAKRLKKLIPTIFDHVQPPLGFRGLQAIDLTQWEVAGDLDNLKLLLDDLNDVLSGTHIQNVSLDQVSGEPPRQGDISSAHQGLSGRHINRRRVLVGVASLSITSIGGIVYWTQLRDDWAANQTRDIRANPQRRIAFLFGQSRYLHVPPLSNPLNDCRLLADTLCDLGFLVIQYSESNRNDLLIRLCDIANAVQSADIVFFYYSGHGMEMNGIPYILPVEAAMHTQYDFEREAVSLAAFFRSVRHGSRITLALFDACRDNPFESAPSPNARGIYVKDGTKLERPMSEPASPQLPPTFEPKEKDAPEAPNNADPSAGDPDSLSYLCFEDTLNTRLGGIAIVYATDKGQLAYDGTGHNSPFAIAVAEAISKPGLELNQVLKLVRRAVLKATEGRQEPWISWSLDEEFYFVPVGG